MNEVQIRFKSVKDGKVIETILDKRLSFMDNFRYLKELTDIDVNRALIYDPHRKIFLDNKTALEKFNITDYMILHLFARP